MTDIVVTWPKMRPLRHYIRDVARAKECGLLINFRIPRNRMPQLEGDEHRCYRVWSGAVRGFTPIVNIEERGLRQVQRVPTDPLYHHPLSRYWPPGLYVVCLPEWHELPDHGPAMPGFRGWRYFDRTTT